MNDDDNNSDEDTEVNEDTSTSLSQVAFYFTG